MGATQASPCQFSCLPYSPLLKSTTTIQQDIHNYQSSYKPIDFVSYDFMFKRGKSYRVKSNYLKNLSGSTTTNMTVT